MDWHRHREGENERIGIWFSSMACFSHWIYLNIIPWRCYFIYQGWPYHQKTLYPLPMFVLIQQMLSQSTAIVSIWWLHQVVTITEATDTATVPTIDATGIVQRGTVQQTQHKTMLPNQLQHQRSTQQAKVRQTLQPATPAIHTMILAVLVSRMHPRFRLASNSRATFRMEHHMMVNEIHTMQYNTIHYNCLLYRAQSTVYDRTRERNKWIAFITTVHFQASAFGRCR